MSSKEKEQEGGSNCISVAALYLCMYRPVPLQHWNLQIDRYRYQVPRWCAVKGKRTKKGTNKEQRSIRHHHPAKRHSRSSSRDWQRHAEALHAIK